MSQSIVNQKDRSVHFWKFFVLFLVSTGLIVAAVYFNYHLADKETDMLRDQVKMYRTQEEAQNKFASKLEDARRIIDSFSTPGVQVTYLDQVASQKIRDLDNNQNIDSSFYGKLNRTAIHTILAYKGDAIKVVNYGNAPKEVEDLKLKLLQLQSSYDEVRKNLDNCLKERQISSDE